MALPNSPRALWAHLTAERHRRRLLIAWGTLALLEVIFRASDLAPIPFTSWLVELSGLTALGIAHAGWAPDDWRGSAAWPSTLGAASVLVRFGWEFISLSFDTVEMLVPLASLGGLVIVAGLIALTNRLLRRIPAVLLSLVAPLALQLIIVGPKQTLEPFTPSPTPSSASAPLVLVTIDTLRADAASEMETVKRLSRRGAYWPRAMAGSSWTWPSIVTLLSGVSADEHRSGRKLAMKQRLNRWRHDLPWLPHDLSEAGYVTAAFTTNPMVSLMRLGPSFDDWHYGNVVRVPLIVRGFPGGDSEGGDAVDVIDAATDWLADAPQTGWFLWVHLYEPHLPYRHATRTVWDYNLLRSARLGDWYMLPEVREDVRTGYREQVAHADREILRLLDALEARDFFSRGTLVFSSDHGEELWEHDGFEHGHSHHGEVVDVPLLVASPGIEPGQRNTVAALEDIANTLRAVAGLESSGLDLREPIPAERVARAYGNLYRRPMRSARVGNTRIIVDGDDIASYDLEADPEERYPTRLNAKELEAQVGKEPEVGAPPGDEEALRALGYVH